MRAKCCYYVKDSSVNKVALIKKLSKMELPEGGDMRQHLMELETLFERIENVGCRLDEDVKGAFMLASLPSSYENTVTVIQGRMEVFRVNFVKTKLLEEFDRRREKVKTEEQTSDQTAMVVKAARKSQNFKRLCFACGSADHLMRNCSILSNLRRESSQSHEGKRNTNSARSAVEETKGHVCFATIPRTTEDVWYLDSGASQHMTGQAANLDWHAEVEPQKVILADGKVLHSSRLGIRDMKAAKGDGTTVQIRLDKVMVVDGLSVNLISVPAITRKGFVVSFDADGCKISKDGRLVVTGVKEGVYYRIDTINV